MGFNSNLIFSGFNKEYRLQLHESMFDMIWHGEGRWDWDTIYNMPIFLRRYWTKRINAILKSKTESIKKQSNASRPRKLPLPTKQSR